LLGYGTYPVPATYTSKIPAIGFTVPNLEAYARVELIRDGSGEVAACLQATLSNGHSTQQKAVAWATGMFTLVALLIGLIHTGLVNSPSPAQYRWFDILYLFQTAAVTGLLHLNYPLVYSNFTQNFAWAIGILYSSKMQSTINKMRAKTGGHLTGQAYSDVQYINRKLSPYNDFININSFASQAEFGSYLSELSSGTARDVSMVGRTLGSRGMISSTIDQNMTSKLSTGLPEYSNILNIPEANAYSTVFFWFLAFIAIAIAYHVFLFIVVWIADRAAARERSVWGSRLRRMWWDMCMGNALYLVSSFIFPGFCLYPPSV